MDTATVNPVVNSAAKQSEVSLPKLSAEQIAELYKPQTIVNNLWEELQVLVDAGFGIQDEYENPTTYAVETLAFALKDWNRKIARDAVARHKRAVDQWSEDHPTARISRDEIALQLLETRGGKRVTSKMEAGKKYLETNK